MSYLQPADSSRKFGGLVVVLLFHVLAVYALVNGLGRKIIQVLHQPLETKIIEEVKAPPPDKPPPPPPPRLAAPPPPYIPLPEVQVQLPLVAPQNAITAVTSVRPTAPVPQVAPRAAVAAPAPPVRSAAAVVEASACEKPEYPPPALRAQETGVVSLAFLIEIDGKVLDSKVERSSGSRRLDEAARRALGLCKFRPATVDGKPEKSWAKIEYEWRIE